MGTKRLGYDGTRVEPTIGDLVVCVDVVKKDINGHNRKFIGLVLDKSATVCKIQVIDTGQELSWPINALYLWKETK